MTMGAESSSSVEFARWAERVLGDVAATVDQVQAYLADPNGVAEVAPTASPPVYAAYEEPPTAVIPVVPVVCPPDRMPAQCADRDTAGRRTRPRTAAAAGAVALTEAPPPARPRDFFVDAARLAEIERYQQEGGEHPGFEEFYPSPAAVFRPDMVTSRIASLFMRNPDFG